MTKMAAFSWPGSCPDPKPQKPLYIKHQSHFYLYDLEELRQAIKEANTTVYIKNPGKQSGSTGIDLWYAKALLEHYATRSSN